MLGKKVENHLNVGVMVCDIDLVIYEWNNWLEVHTNIKESDIIGKKLHEVLENIDIVIFKKKIKTALVLKSYTFMTPLHNEYIIPIPMDRFSNAELKFMYQIAHVSPLDLEKQKVVISIYDQSEVVIAKKRLHNEMENVKDLNYNLQRDKNIIDKNLMMLKCTLDGYIEDASSAFLNFYEYTLDELIGEEPKVLRHEDMPSILFKEMWETIKSNKTWRGEIKNKSKSGNENWIDTIISPLIDINGNPTHYTAIYHDITDKKRLEELSKKDPLTKLYNRRYFDILCENEMNNKRKNKKMSLALIDIDYFKRINDTYGHKVGDTVLIEFSKILQDSMRESDICARIGGEEFIVILNNTDLVSADIAMTKFKNNIEKHNFETVGHITCSIGVSDKHESDMKDDLYKRADKNLYRAKSGGRNRVIGSSI